MDSNAGSLLAEVRRLLGRDLCYLSTVLFVFLLKAFLVLIKLVYILLNIIVCDKSYLVFEKSLLVCVLFLFFSCMMMNDGE